MIKFLRKNCKKFLIVLLSALFMVLIGACGGSKDTASIGLSVDKTAVALLPGDEVVLKAKYDAEDVKLVWKSDNETVAKVDSDGKITAYAEGEATVTVSYKKEQQSCKVTVDANSLLPVATLEGITEENVSVSLVDTLNVNPKVLFNGKTFDDATWSYQLSDASVGEIKDGVFAPKKVGETTLTITGAWRGFTSSTLIKSFTINVIDLTTVVINGGETSSLFLYTAESHGGKAYATSSPFEVVVTENGNAIASTVTVTKGADVISYDAANQKVSALTYGEAELTISFTDGNGTENALAVPVTVQRPVMAYADTIEYFSAMDGDIPVATIFGSNVDLVDAYQGDTALTVKNNKVLGVATDRTGITQTTITVYNETVGYTLDLEAYTKVIDSESDLSVFGNMRETVDGYFVLKNDIECVGEWINKCDFAGTFDGQGYAIKNITFGHMTSGEQLSNGKWDARRGGLFGSIVGGATIKNLAVTGVYLKGYDSAVLAASSQASYYVNSTIENLYISIANVNTQGRPGALFWERGVWDRISNVIVDASALNGITTFGNTYGALFACDKYSAIGGTSWTDDDKRITNVFVIAEAGTPMMKNTAYGTHTSTIYASNEGITEDKDKKEYVYTGVKRCDNFAALVAAVNKVGDDENYWTISELGIEWKGSLPEVETIVYDKTIEYFSAMDGVLPLKEIFGTDDVVITEAYQNGTKLKVENNKVLGVATLNNQMTETQILIFSAKANYLLNVEAYTKVIDEESDLSVFDTSGGVVNGYFILKNDVVCTGEKEWTNLYNTSEAEGSLKYFNGVLDGRGHKIIGLKVGENGLLGAMSASAVVKDIAFTETVLAGGSWKNTALLGHVSLASSGSGSAIENVYVHIKDFREASGGDRAAGLLYVYNKDITINNVIMQIDSTNMKPDPQFGYGALFEHDRIKGSASNITNVYLVSILMPLAMHSQVDLTTGIAKESCVIYAGNDKNTAGKLEKNSTLYYEGVERYDTLDALSEVVTRVGNWAISASGVTWVADAE